MNVDGFSCTEATAADMNTAIERCVLEFMASDWTPPGKEKQP